MCAAGTSAGQPLVGLRAEGRLSLRERRRSPRNVLKFVVERCRGGFHGSPWTPLARRGPQTVGEHERIKHAMPGPPGAFIPRLVQGIVVSVAQGYGELV